MTFNSIGFQLSWITLVSANMPKTAKPRACALSAQAAGWLFQAGPSCLKHSNHCRKPPPVNHWRKAKGPSEVIALRPILPAAAHPSLTSHLQPVPPMQKFSDVSNTDRQLIHLKFFKTGEKFVVVALFEFSEKTVYPKNSLLSWYFSFALSFLCSFIKHLWKNTSGKRSIKDKEEKKISDHKNFSSSLLKSIIQKLLSKTREDEREKNH